ncbi:unnamed protein product [Pneumocystis jirovecii]|uniref:Uncharacterized protein n=2 Tax=Pneumocystis jirovecii TaxID=42068 RepID=L0PD53_PNEJI|nr:uncharacterized protein T551_03512 [Pneumocystis jirovecii RU7]KTW26595.1 hypothetical protein T551_03512 [Pneumocystis jirovecii RU7]CCJ30014.1 unnamed protein product [Pneumocystis jirovecii]
MLLIRFFRIILPLLASLAGLVYISLTMAGGFRRHPFLDKVYLFKIDTTNIQAYKFPSERPPNVTPAEHIGLNNHYYFYMWGHCDARRHMYLKRCTKPKIGYHFNPLSILREKLLKGSVVKVPSKTGSFTDKVKIGSIVMTGLYAAGLVFSALLFLSKLIFAIFDLDDKAPRVIAGLAMIFNLLAATSSTALIIIIKRTIKTDAGYLNLKVHYGKSSLIYSWVAAYTVLIAYISLLIANRQLQKRRQATEKLY